MGFLWLLQFLPTTQNLFVNGLCGCVHACTPVFLPHADCSLSAE